jgi:hypothetical membrane protein
METPEVGRVELSKKCACPCHKMFGVFIALVGILGLLAAFYVMSHKIAGIIGCVLLVLAGLQTMLRGKCNCCTAP